MAIRLVVMWTLEQIGEWTLEDRETLVLIYNGKEPRNVQIGV